MIFLLLSLLFRRFRIVNNIYVACAVVVHAVGTAGFDYIVVNTGGDKSPAVFAVPAIGGIVGAEHLCAPSVEDVALVAYQTFVAHFPEVVDTGCGFWRESVGNLELGFAYENFIYRSCEFAGAIGIVGAEPDICGSLFLE